MLALAIEAAVGAACGRERAADRRPVDQTALTGEEIRARLGQIQAAAG